MQEIKIIGIIGSISIIIGVPLYNYYILPSQKHKELINKIDSRYVQIINEINLKNKKICNKINEIDERLKK